MKNYIYLLLSVFTLGLVLSGCEDDEDVRSGNISVQNVMADSDKRYIRVEDNQTLQLETFVMPQSKTSKVTFALTGTLSGAIEITPDGLITPLVKTPATGDIPSPLGVDTIIVTLDSDPNIFVKYPVRVYSNIKLITSITLQSAGQFPEIETGKTFNLAQYITVNPADATDKTLTYVSKNESVARVDQNGLITAVSEGTAEIVITSNDRTKTTVTVFATVIDRYTGPLDLNRTGWKVTTSHPYVPDAAISGTPESLIDGALLGNRETCLSLYKPGAAAGGVPSTDVVYFIIEMPEQEEFEYFKLRHRTDNTSSNLRVVEVSFYGSNDGTTFELIKGNVPISGTENEVTITLDQPVRFKYVKMTYNRWNTSGNTMQISEFNMGSVIR